jgi:hypothetical protein
MKSKINVALAVCALTTTLLLISHLVLMGKFVDLETNELSAKIHHKEFDLIIRLEEKLDKKLKVFVWFSLFKSPLMISDLYVSVDRLSLIEIETYPGMKNWELKSYLDFSSIPDSAKHLTLNLNPYFAFDHVFLLDANDKDRFETKINLVVKHNDENEHLEKTIVFKRAYKIDFQAWGHEDLSFFLIPVLGLCTLILLLFKISRS